MRDEPSEENRRSWLLDKLRGPDVGAAEPAVGLVERFCDLYAEHGLFDGDQARPLDCDCPDASTCWAGVRGDRHPPREEAPVSVPWVGATYRPGGVAAVGINFNAYGGLGAQWWIRRGAIRDLRQGKRKRFDYRAGSYLALLQASLAGERLEAEPDRARVADAWDASAFFETIKCSPLGQAGRPTEAMWANCALRYMAAELRLIEPGTLLLIGRRVGDQVTALLDAEIKESDGGFRRGHATLAGRRTEVFCCNHPSWGHWRASVPSLLRSLEARPVPSG